jgi:KRAB domain-containing zinc finger protein
VLIFFLLSFYQSSVGEQLCTSSRQRAFCCEVCNKAFGQQSHLMIHKQIQSGERLLCCDVCNKAFNERPTLMTHKQRIHSGEQPF